MRISTLFKFLVISVFCFHATVSLVADQNQDSQESALDASSSFGQQAELLNQQISDIETEFGPYDQKLLEPLQTLTDLFIEVEDLEEAESLLDRRLQLLRIVEGPSTLNQLPVISNQISISLRNSQWASVSDHLEYIRLLHSQNQNVDAIAALSALNNIRYWHQSLVFVDDVEQSLNHIIESRKVLPDILSLVEQEFANEPRQIVSWLYGIALDQHRVAGFIGPNGILEGQRLVALIQEIVQSMGDPEAAAMAMLYVADFEALHQRWIAVPGLGNRVASRIRGGADSYSAAMELLAEAGLEQEKIDEFFTRPVLIPVSQFHFSLDDALAQQVADGYSLEPTEESEDQITHIGVFTGWSENFPSAPHPPLPDFETGFYSGMNSALVKFDIDTLGRPRSIRIEQSDPDSRNVRSAAILAIETSQFRPVFSEGRWIRMEDLTMQFNYPSIEPAEE